ncbi:MAG: VWA domain-containing protein [Candidatus Babeliales bacterium]
MNFSFFGITFQAPELWKLLPFFLIGGALCSWQCYKRCLSYDVLAVSKWRSLLLKHASKVRQWAKSILFSLGLLFLFITLLRPAWGKKEDIIKQEGRDLLIALDVSKSMLAQDRSPNRLEFAKAKIKKLLHKLDYERVGLMLFAGATIVQCPLTNDYKAFYMFLDQVDQNTISSGSTALDQALMKALELFEKMPSKKNKLLVIFTDGEDFSSNLSTIRAKAASMGLTIFTVGLGTAEGAPIPLYDERGESIGHQKDEKGSVVISRLNEGILRTLADETGGSYVLAQENNEDIATIIKRVQQFEKEAIEDKRIIQVEERYPYFAAVSLFFFILEWLL